MRRLAPLAVMLVALVSAACSESSEPNREVLRNPADTMFQATAPERFRASFETTRGTFLVEIERAWSPNGVDRLYNLIRTGYYDDARFFRVIEGSIAQFGINGEPRTSVAWATQTFPDDPRVLSNERGTISFAMRGEDSRTTQLFINFVDNPALDEQGFTPVARIVAGMDVADQIYSGYGEMAPRGGGPAPQFILQRGNNWLRSEYPRLDYIEEARIEPTGS